MKATLIFLPVFLFSSLCFSQNTSYIVPEYDYLPIGIGLSFYQSKDSYNSPNRHRGLTSKFLMGFEKFSLEEVQRHRVSFMNGSLSNGTKNGRKLGLNQMVYRTDLGFRETTAARNVTEPSNAINYFVGLSLKVNFSSRSGGRIYQFDAAATLAVTASATYDFLDFQFDEDRWFYDASVSLPLAGFGLRPRFASPGYEGDLPGRKKPTTGFIYFPKHFDLDLQFNANWDIGNGNILRSGYRWWWYDSRQMHRVRMLENGLQFFLMTRLN